MVTIINGEIVPDNDPRAKAYRERKSNQNSQSQTRNRSTNQNATTDREIQNGGRNDRNSPVTEINNYLVNAGMPRLNMGGTVIQPIFLIAALLVIIFMGPSGILIIGIGYFLYVQSQRAGH